MLATCWEQLGWMTIERTDIVMEAAARGIKHIAYTHQAGRVCPQWALQKDGRA